MNNKEKKTHSMKARGMISDVIVHVVLALLAIVWVIPVLWIALLSFSTQKGSYVTSFFPKGYTLHNYVRLFTDTQVLDFPQMFKNTFIIAVFSCLISTIFVLSVSYCMSRMRFKIRKTYMNIAMILGLFPAFMSMVAVYYILKAVGLSEGSMIRVALILVYSGGSGARSWGWRTGGGAGSARRADRREIVVCGRGECVGGREDRLDLSGGQIGVSLLTGAKFGDRMKKIFPEFFVIDL